VVGTQRHTAATSEKLEAQNSASSYRGAPMFCEQVFAFILNKKIFRKMKVQKAPGQTLMSKTSLISKA
jgi:hypothetical protein